MCPDPRVLFPDVDWAGAEIKRFIDGLGRATSVGYARTQTAVEREVEISGEALNRLHQSHPDNADRIPTLREVVSFRNLLIHGDAAVIPDRIRRYAGNDLPALRETV